MDAKTQDRLQNILQSWNLALDAEQVASETMDEFIDELVQRMGRDAAADDIMSTKMGKEVQNRLQLRDRRIGKHRFLYRLCLAQDRKEGRVT